MPMKCWTTAGSNGPPLSEKANPPKYRSPKRKNAPGLLSKNLARQHEGGQVEGVGVAFPDVPDCVPQGSRPVGSREEAVVEGLHELRRALVRHLPERDQDRCRPGAEETPRQPEELVSGGDHVEPRHARAQRDELRRQLEVVEVIEREVGAAQADPGEHRVVAPKEAVGGDVDEPAPLSL